MWHFINLATRQSPQGTHSQPPRTAALPDGSLVHLINGEYTFQPSHLAPEHQQKTRRSSLQSHDLPSAFKVPTPLFLWPNQDTLYERILEHLLARIEEEANLAGQHVELPEPSELTVPIKSVKDVLQHATPTPGPNSPDATDHLGVYMDRLAGNIIQRLPREIHTAIMTELEDVLRNHRIQTGAP